MIDLVFFIIAVAVLFEKSPVSPTGFNFIAKEF